MNQSRTTNQVWTLRPEPVGPLAPYIDTFVNLLHDQGYKRRVIGRQAQSVARFSRWLKANHIALSDLCDQHVEQFLSKLKRRNRVRGGYQHVIGRFIVFLRTAGVITIPAVLHERTAIHRVLAAYSAHLRHDRGSSRATLVQYLPFAERFLFERFATAPLDLSSLSAADVLTFIKREAVRLSPARAKCATTALRSFLLYLRYRGDITLDLATAVPSVANWSATSIPRAISAQHVRAVLASCQRDTPVGCRDYAILLLLARLGLRAGEIVSLTLDSIDWQSGSLIVKASKSGQLSQLPLTADVGEAIADYLQNARPPSRSRTLFLRALAPVRGLGSSTSVSTIVRAAILRAGVETRHKGTHQFRHALACEMLRQGATLTEIGTVLRHRRTKTTSLYAKVDFAALRPLSLPWPGGAA
jgi:integrase/recombinase XerD